MFDPSIRMNYQIVTLFLIPYLNFIGIKYSFSYTFCLELTYAGFKEQSPWHFNVIIHSPFGILKINIKSYREVKPRSLGKSNPLRQPELKELKVSHLSESFMVQSYFSSFLLSQF